MQDIQDIIDTITYVKDFAGQTTTPSDCYEMECIIFDEFRKIAKNNGFQTNSMIPYNRALQFFTQLASAQYTLGFIKSSDISAALTAGGFTSVNNLTFDECICIIKLFTVKYLQQARMNTSLDYDQEIEADEVSQFINKLPNKKCKNYSSARYYTSQ